MQSFTRNRLFAPVIALTLGLSAVPVTAQAATSAELQSELNAVSEQLYALYSEAEAAGADLDAVTADLNNTVATISDLEVQIDEQQVTLKDKQSQLSELLSAQYKSGDTMGLLSLILSSSDFADLVSNVHYANKISEQKQSAIAEVRDLQEALEQNKSELETQKTEQEQLVADKQAKSDSAAAAATEAQNYYNQLSDEVKAAIAEEEAAARAAAEEAARQAAEEAAAKAAEEEAAAAAAAAAQEQQSQSSEDASAADTGSNSTPSNNSSNTSTNTNNSSSNNSSNNSSSNNSSNNSSSNNSSSNNSSNNSSSNNSSSNKKNNSSTTVTPTPTSSVSTMVSRALSVVGSGYTWSGYVWTGSTSSSYFTCSGLVDYALGNPTNTTWPESLYSSVSYITTDQSALNYGDLVFYTYGGRYPGHVGIYIGGGQIVDSIPGGGVAVRDINYPGTFIGGGPIL